MSKEKIEKDLGKFTKILNIHERIIGVMKDLDYIQKGNKMVNGQYRFVSHDQVTAAIHPLLVTHGITVITSVKSFVQNGNRTEVVLTVQLINVDNPTDFVSTEWFGFGIDASDKGPGKAISYAFKYAILKTFVLETGDDPDMDCSVKHVPEKPPVATESIISESDYLALDELIGVDMDCRRSVMGHLKDKYGITSLKNIPMSLYGQVYRGVQLKKERDAGGAQ